MVPTCALVPDRHGRADLGGIGRVGQPPGRGAGRRRGLPLPGQGARPRRAADRDAQHATRRAARARDRHGRAAAHRREGDRAHPRGLAARACRRAGGGGARRLRRRLRRALRRRRRRQATYASSRSTSAAGCAATGPRSWPWSAPSDGKPIGRRRPQRRAHGVAAQGRRARPCRRRPTLGGNGGGKDDVAQGGGTDPSQANAALRDVERAVGERVTSS